MPFIRALVQHGKTLQVLVCVIVILPLFTTRSAAQEPDRLRLQLMWVHQAQFAGIYTAIQKGFYERERLRVELIEGGPGINPINVLAKGEADVAVAWLPYAIDARARGHEVVNIAQIFQRPGMAIACRRDAGVQSVNDVFGKTMGVWDVGDELNVRYWLRSINIRPRPVPLA